jgi:hypothetical protein
VNDIEVIWRVEGLKMETKLQSEKLKELNHLLNLNVDGRTFKNLSQKSGSGLV